MHLQPYLSLSTQTLSLKQTANHRAGGIIMRALWHETHGLCRRERFLHPLFNHGSVPLVQPIRIPHAIDHRYDKEASMQRHMPPLEEGEGK